MDYNTRALELHKKHMGKLAVASLTTVTSKEDLSTIYTPGVAAVSKAIGEDKSLARTLTMKGRTVAIVSDGSAILGLGNLGPEAAMPVMEGKAVLFKELAGVDAIPLCIDTQDTEEIITFVKQIAPSFGGVNLEDISAPRCFEIERRLKAELDIPIFHDDQHGTATVVLAGLLNSLKLVGKSIDTISVVINGAGAAGIAIAKLLIHAGVQHLILCDSKGIISKGRDGLNSDKEAMLESTNLSNMTGGLHDALQKSDVFIGVSAGDILKAADIETMNTDAIVLAMANPTPEIMPEEALKGGAKVVGTGRSDFPNQVNNALVFPGLFKGALASGSKDITTTHLTKAAQYLADLVEAPTTGQILPDVLDPRVADAVAKAFE